MILRVHTLRGLAGNIGATQLARLAADIESQLKASPQLDAAILESRLAELHRCLPDVVAQAARFANETAVTSLPVTTELPADALAELQHLLDNDDALAVRHFEAIAPQLQQIFAAHAVDQLAYQIDRYDFDDAKETLAHLIQQRQITD